MPLQHPGGASRAAALIARFRCATSLAMVLMSGTALGQQSATLAPVVVTPARVSQSLDTALPSTTVITRADIEQWQERDLVSALARQAGLEFARTGGFGAQSSLFIRGAGSAQALVLVDGVPLNSVVSGGAALGGIALDTVERIEIVRGNLSSLYGSAAIGGVVQIFTRQGRRGVDLALEAGQGRTLNGSATAGWDGDGTRVSATVGGHRDRQFSAIDTAQVIPGPFAPGANADLDGNRNTSGALSASHTFAGGARLSARAWLSRNTTDFDSTADGPTALQVEKSRQDALALEARLPVTARWDSTLTLGQTRDRSGNTSTVPFSFNNGSFESRNRQATWLNALGIEALGTATVGLEWLQQQGGSTSFDPGFDNALTTFDRTVKSVWLGLAGVSGPAQWQANVRHDDYSDVGGATTGLACIGWMLLPQLRASAQASTAFRAPSFNDLYFPFFGNPALKPEKSTSGEAGLQYTPGAWVLKAALYRTDTRDLIVYDPATRRAENVDRARATGLELDASTRLGAWDFGLNAAFSRPEDRATGERLLRRAATVWNARVAWADGPWRPGLEAGRVGARFDSDINTFDRTTLAAYTLARVVAAYRITPALTARLRVENLTDAQYRTVSGYNVQPRTLIGGLSASF